jgi:hydrogenase nickel incorporation protein HypA/HybF
MHELTATQELVATAVEQARLAGAGRVTDVWLEIGSLSTITEEAVRFYWPGIARGTTAADSRLHVELVPGLISCRTCGLRGAADDLPICSACGSPDVSVVQGGVCRLSAIDIEAAVVPGPWEVHAGTS